jgi:hypothetical protein
MAILTTYFGNDSITKIEKVSIERNPKWNGRTARKLFVPQDIENWWRKLPKEKKESEEYQLLFISIYYREVLCKLDPEKVYKALDGKMLVGFAKKNYNTNEFSHRQIIAEWLQNNGYDCYETPSSPYKDTVVSNWIVETLLSNIKSDKDLYKIFGDMFADFRTHVYKLKMSLALCINVDCRPTPSQIMALNDAAFKNNIDLYVKCGTEYVKVDIDYFAKMVYGSIITINIPDELERRSFINEKGETVWYYYKERGDKRTEYFYTGEKGPSEKAAGLFKSRLIAAKKMNKCKYIYEMQYYQKEATSYNGDFFGTIDYEEYNNCQYYVQKTTKEYTYTMYNKNAINIVGDLFKLVPKDIHKIFTTFKYVTINLNPTDKEKFMHDWELTFRVNKNSSYDTLEQSVYRRLFDLGDLDITKDVIGFLWSTVYVNMSEYLETQNQECFDLVNNLINMNLTFEDYLENIRDILKPDANLDYFLSAILSTRVSYDDMTRFYEDRKDDDYESINSSYLGKDDD